MIKTGLLGLTVLGLRSLLSRASSLLCQKAGVPPSEELRRYFNMGVPAGRMKADRNIVLCVPDGPCYADAAARRAGKEVKRQPRIHHASCMYKQLELVQQQQGGR